MVEQDRAERRSWLVHHILPHEPGLRRKLQRWGLPEDLDVEDVVQEAYAKLSYLPSVAEIYNPRNYLYQVAKSIINAHIRRSKVVSIHLMADLESVAGDGDLPSTEMEISDRQQLHRLTQAIAGLPDPMRSVVYYRVVEELQFQDIGDRLSVSQNAAQKIFAKALKQLAHYIGWGETSSVDSADGNAAGKMAPGHVASK